MDIISQNPYRILGVYSTSPKKDVVANQGRMKAFLKVGKSCEFPTDFPNLLQTIARTEESVAEANAKLTLPKEQLKFAQFWFAKATTFDDIAFNHLTAGNTGQALEIWTKKDCASSLQNRIVCALINDDIEKAIRCAETLYADFSTEFVKMILGENSTVQSNDLAHSFLDVLCEEIGASKFINNISNSEWRDYVGSKCVRPLIDGILAAVETAKQSKGKGSAARLKAGTKLMNDTKAQFSKLREFLQTSDLQYQMIADKLGLEILQCGIDYYNDSEEYDAAFKAKVLQEYALSIVVGQMAIDRCKENVEILKDIIKNLPPKEVFAEDKDIKEELRKFCQLPDKICHAVTLLNNTKPHLQAIKNKLGASNSFYLKVSTSVVGNALHNLIEEVNAAQALDKMTIGDITIDVPVEIMTDLQRQQKLNKIKSALRAAWDAIKIMDSFDMESDFKTNRYNSNRSTLAGLCRQMGISTYTPASSPIKVSEPRRTSPASTYNSNRPPANSNEKMPGWLAYCIGVVAVGIIGAIFNGGEGFGVGCIWGLFIGGPIAKAILSE